MTGTWSLLRMALRRDRVVVPAWILVFVGVAVSAAAATNGLYPSEAARVQAARTVNAAPALVAIYGPVYDETSLGALAFFKLSVFGAALIGLLAALLVVRHTRADEELGRTELVASGAVGRHAALMAGVLVGALTSVTIGLATAVGTATTGLATTGCIALGAAWAGCGLAFTGVGAVAAQLTASARTARGIAVGTLAVAYVVRAAADTTDAGWLTWLSPVGWAQQVRPFAGERLWPVALLLALALAGVATAVLVESRRDLASGVLAPRAGPPRGRIGDPVGLAWRLHRMSLAGWTVGVLLLGLVQGSLVTHLGGFLDSPQVRRYIETLGGRGFLTDAFLSTEFSIVAFVVSGFALSVIARMRAEESSGRVEPVLASGTGRVAWMVSHLLLAVLGRALLMAASGGGGGVAHALQSGDISDLGRDLGAALVRLPAVWVLTGVGAALFGLAGRWTGFAWAVLVACLVVGEFGQLMGLPEWTKDVSPYSHVPPVPAQPLEPGPLLALLAVAAVLLGGGLVAFRRRDVALG